VSVGATNSTGAPLFAAVRMSWPQFGPIMNCPWLTSSIPSGDVPAYWPMLSCSFYM
jgi:hypothetical protein